MKFEIDPNELTTEQRAHVAAFITGWPRDPAEEAVRTILNQGSSGQWGVTEEQRLDAEQKSDMDTTGELREISGVDEARELGAAAEDNLNAIFGAPTASERIETIQNLNSLVLLDKEGLPWDSRIHASTKTFIADGSWKLRRGVDPAEVEKVKAQLKELMAVPVAGVGTVNVPIMPTVDPRITTIPPAPVLTPTSVGYVPVPPAPKSHYLIDQQPVDTPISGPKSHYLIDQQPATVTLTDLIARMSSAIVAGKITQATVTEMCAKHGVSEFMLLSSRPDLLPLIDADMKAMGV